METNNKNFIIESEVTKFVSCGFENELSLSIRLDSFCIMEATCTLTGKCLITLALSKCF